jgi:hypothetical protein
MSYLTGFTEGTGVVLRSRTLSSFCFSFFRSASEKRKTDKMLSTLLPQAGYPLGVAFKWGTA